MVKAEEELSSQVNLDKEIMASVIIFEDKVRICGFREVEYNAGWE